MGDRKVLKGELEADEVERREIFLSTYYVEARDTFKQLFTLNSAVLIVFSTYAKDKLIEKVNSDFAYWAVGTYAVFLLSIFLCIIGFYLIQLAAEKATNLSLWTYRWSLGQFGDYCGFALLANWCLELSGVMFFVGVLLIGRLLVG